MIKRSPVFQSIVSAHQRIFNFIQQTPLLESPQLNAQLGARLFFKAEALQTTGSFKLRGAYNFISQLLPAQRQHGIVACSSGNHAQAVAYVAEYFQIPATIVMPQDAPAIKIEKTRSYGAEVVLYDRYSQSREAIAQQIAREQNCMLVPPYDHPWVIAGQGTVGLELFEQAQKEYQTDLEAVLIPCSGGGLAAGCAIALSHLSPTTKLYAVEPQGFEDTTLSLQAKQRLKNLPGAKTICDALMLPEPGEVTFPINVQYLTGGIAVSDTAVTEAMKLLYKHFNLVVEPGGAVGLAAVLENPTRFQNQAMGIILSGGNV